MPELAFLPGLGVGAPTNNWTKQSRNNRYFNEVRDTTPFNNPNEVNMNMVDKVVDAYRMVDNLPPEVKDTMRKTAGDAINRVRGRRRNHGSGYSLSPAPDPMLTELNTGIKPNCYVLDIMDAEENACSPLHVTCAKLSIPSVAGNQIYDYFMRIIAFDIQTKAQANVGFNLNIQTDFTPEKLLTAMNDLITALQRYYYISSVLTYHSAYENKNEGMIFLRALITPVLLENYSALGRRLADTPVPPNLLEFIRYLNTNYLSGDNPGSPMIKMVPISSDNGSMMFDNGLKDSILALSTPANSQIFALMRRAVPHWKPGPLKDVPLIPVYDQNFLTIFANLPLSSDRAIATAPNAIMSSDTIEYNSFSNVLDGAAYALTSIHNGAEWLPSLLVPSVNQNPNNRRSFYKLSGVPQFVNSDSYNFLSRSRPETYQFSDDGLELYGLHLPGADKVRGVSFDAVRETLMTTLDYLMSLNTIVKNTKSDGNNPVTKSGRNRRKSKEK